MSSSDARTVTPSLMRHVIVTLLRSASGRSRCSVPCTACCRSTIVTSGCTPSSRRDKSSSFSVVRCRRSASLPMSATNSRIVVLSMSALWEMLSDSRRMDASGVLSSCDASETNRRRWASVVSSRSVRLLNSRPSSVSSSSPESVRRKL